MAFAHAVHLGEHHRSAFISHTDCLHRRRLRFIASRVRIAHISACADASKSSASPAATPQSALSRALRVVPDARDNASLWALACVGALWTVSNLMVVSILPLYMRDVLGLSSTKIGAVEGAAIAAAFASKMASGVASDLLRSRTYVILVGASMTAVAKPAFSAAGAIRGAFGSAAAFKFIVGNKVFDRLSKGVRAAPTDALLADLSPGQARGRAYSLMQAAATSGGVLGSLLCTGAMLATGNSYRATFLLAGIPASLAIVLLLVAVRQPSNTVGASRDKKRRNADWGSAFRLSPRFYASAVVVSLLYMARFSESFVMLRARSVGTALTLIPLLATANQVVQAVLAYPMGVIADILDARVVLVIGWCFIIASHLVFLSVPTPLGTTCAFVLVAVHMAMTQANTKSLLSQNLAPNQRGTGFAVFSIMSGVALAGGNILAGLCNDIALKRGMGMVGCFYSGAFFSSLSLVLLLLYMAVFKKEKFTPLVSSE